jgi:hypothetical protein
LHLVPCGGLALPKVGLEIFKKKEALATSHLVFMLESNTIENNLKNLCFRLFTNKHYEIFFSE